MTDFNANQRRFRDIYRDQLRAVRLKKPNEYLWPITDLDMIVDKMVNSLTAGTANHVSTAVRGTCRILGIDATRTDISAFLKGN